MVFKLSRGVPEGPTHILWESHAGAKTNGGGLLAVEIPVSRTEDPQYCLLGKSRKRKGKMKRGHLGKKEKERGKRQLPHGERRGFVAEKGGLNKRATICRRQSPRGVCRNAKMIEEKVGEKVTRKGDAPKNAEFRRLSFGVGGGKVGGHLGERNPGKKKKKEKIPGKMQPVGWGCASRPPGAKQAGSQLPAKTVRPR